MPMTETKPHLVIFASHCLPTDSTCHKCKGVCIAKGLTYISHQFMAHWNRKRSPSARKRKTGEQIIHTALNIVWHHSKFCSRSLIHPLSPFQFPDNALEPRLRWTLMFLACLHQPGPVHTRHNLSEHSRDTIANSGSSKPANHPSSEQRSSSSKLPPAGVRIKLRYGAAARPWAPPAFFLGCLTPWFLNFSCVLCTPVLTQIGTWQLEGKKLTSPPFFFSLFSLFFSAVRQKARRVGSTFAKENWQASLSRATAERSIAKHSKAGAFFSLCMQAGRLFSSWPVLRIYTVIGISRNTLLNLLKDLAYLVWFSLHTYSLSTTSIGDK